MTHPYADMGSQAFWKTAVAELGAEHIHGLWTPEFRIDSDSHIVTAGSCFAQHIGSALQGRGYHWKDHEPAPPFLLGKAARDFGYGVFSFRTGNIYTPAMLMQWLKLAFQHNPDVGELWEANGRWFDPLRPGIEPGGFASRQEVVDARANTLHAIREAVQSADVFVFTLGLTESWTNRITGLEYATCPGTVAGQFDPDKHVFTNSDLRSTNRTLSRAMRFLRDRNPGIRILLTVSPVPLTATASGQHVLTATSYSKAVLRASAGMAKDRFRFVDYFPSYEIITHPVFGGRFFEPNMRSVHPDGVAHVMSHFFADQARAFGQAQETVMQEEASAIRVEDDVRCEEEMLDAFAR